MACVGCSPEARRRVIDALFDEPPARDEPAGESEVAGPERPELPPNQPPPLPRRRSTWVGTTHGPYAARLCQECHAGKGENPVEGAGAARLRFVRRELCLHCHEGTLLAFAPPNQGARRHGPVAAGMCLACHLPHRSREKVLLRSAPEALCERCHRLADLGGRHPVVRPADCIDCHDPHRPLPAKAETPS